MAPEVFGIESLSNPWWRTAFAQKRRVGLLRDPHPNPLPQAGEGEEAVRGTLSRERERVGVRAFTRQLNSVSYEANADIEC